MKKQILLFLALIMSMMATAQVTIQMEKEGGVYKVPCSVNGVKMKFIFDTGATTVSMSQTMAQFLLDGDYLSVSDIKGAGNVLIIAI
jgi:predicted aspartyl protease